MKPYPILADLSSSQGGYFLANQATAAGIDRFRLGRLERQGFLERDSRGLYRVAGYPLTDESELWAALLWAGLKGGSPQAVLSDDTALSLYDVSTINPTRVDLTVPKGARIRRVDTPATYKVWYRNYTATDVTRIRGLPTTTLARTLFDLLLAGRGRQFVDEALEAAPKRKLLTKREASTLQLLREGDPALLQAWSQS